MSVRTTIDIPDELHAALRARAASDRTSIRALVLDAIGSRYQHKRPARKRLTGPPIKGSGKPGPRCPDRENPYDILFG